jgi:hypothetical protein
VREYRDALGGLSRRLAAGDHVLTCDRFGRVHTLLTRLHRDLRGCLSVNGEPLAGWDLKNSQPLFAGLLACWFVRSKDARYRLGRATFADAGNPYNYESLGGPTGRDGLPDDLAEYIRCYEAGRFYETFGRDRDRVKTAMLTILMGPNKYRWPVKAAFEARFPTVAGVLRDLKR